MSEVNGATLTCGLAVASVLKYAGLAWLRRIRRRQLVPVGKVTDLFIYPLKSGRPIALDVAQCTPIGFQEGTMYDRQFILSCEGKLLTARQHPSLVLVSIKEVGDNFVFDAPEMESLVVPRATADAGRLLLPCRVFDDDIYATDLGDQAAKWFTRYIKESTECRLLAYNSKFSTRYLANAIRPWDDLALESDVVAFADYSAYLVTTNETLAEVQSRITNSSIKMLNFRPNIVMSGVPAFTEEKWTEMIIGKVSFRCVDLASRCVETTVHPDKGVKDEHGEPLKTLFKTHKCPIRRFAIFGVWAQIDVPGKIRVGDTVYAM